MDTLYQSTYVKPDGVIEFGYGVDSFPPGTKPTGQGPCAMSDWWRIWWDQSDIGWHLCRDARHNERLLAGAAETCEEFFVEATKPSHANL